METIVVITAFGGILTAVICMFVYVLASKRRKGARLYQDAAALESSGNYEGAIELFEAYIREYGEADAKKQDIANRIKTLRLYETPVNNSFMVIVNK